MEEILLLPVPRKINIEKSICRIPSKPGFFISGVEQNIDFFTNFIKETTKKHTGNMWKQTETSPSAFLSVICDSSCGIEHQGYKIIISKNSIKIESSDASGAYYGLCTLKQILMQKNKNLPVLQIYDYPDFSRRGVMIDISRSKVPKMETLYNLIDLLSSWKINEFQLYTEHTFAYKGHEIVWKDKSPVTPEEIRNLDDFCKKRFIDLVPNQNSFGHFQRWLQHPKYKHLAEDPDNPYTLCPTDPGSIELLDELYGQLLPNFSSKYFNVGCDETVIGKRSAPAVKEKGEGRVYLEFLLKIYNLTKKYGKTMQFWGDIVQRHPELIPEIPKDVIVLEWGYESDHPFAYRCKKIKETGIPFYVCPGTSTWNTIAGRTENCLANLINAAQNGLRTGAMGFLNTDWGDNGHWQYLPISYIGFGFGAGVSWCLRTNFDADIKKQTGFFAFDDKSFNAGNLAYEIGSVATATGIHISNTSPLFTSIREDLETPVFTSMIRKTGINNAQNQIKKAMSYLSKTKINNKEKDIIKEEFKNAARLLEHACKRALLMLEGYETEKNFPEDALKMLVKDAQEIIKTHKKLWLKRNRPGGLEESIELLERFIITAYKKFL